MLLLGLGVERSEYGVGAREKERRGNWWILIITRSSDSEWKYLFNFELGNDICKLCTKQSLLGARISWSHIHYFYYFNEGLLKPPNILLKLDIVGLKNVWVIDILSISLLYLEKIDEYVVVWMWGEGRFRKWMCVDQGYIHMYIVLHFCSSLSL